MDGVQERIIFTAFQRMEVCVEFTACQAESKWENNTQLSETDC